MPEAFSPIGQLPLLKRTTQNVVIYSYETKLGGLWRHLTIAWVKTLNGHSLHVGVDDPSCHYTCKVKINSWKSFWNKQGMRSFEVGTSSTTTTTRTTTRVDIYWDFSHPKYVFNGPEPQGGYFVGIVCNDEMVLLLGDKSKEAYKRTRARPPVNDATLLSRKEHIFGKKSFCTKGRLDDTDKTYDIVIEYGLSEEEEEEHCDNVPDEGAPGLSIKIEKQRVIHVKNLEWKFRGNQTVVLDGVSIEVFWDVHNWLFSHHASPSPTGSAIFIFQKAGPCSDKNKFDRAASAANLCGGLNGSISLMKLPNARSLRSSRELLLGDLRGTSLMIQAWRT